MRPCASLAWLCVALVGVATGEIVEADHKVYVIRHGEKSYSAGFNSCLNSTGVARSKLLPAIFDGTRFRSPDALYAWNYLPRASCQRCIEMLHPIANALDLPINDTYGLATGSTAAAAGIRAASRAKPTILVAWEHHQLPGFAKALGADPALVGNDDSWPKGDFDTVYVLSYSADSGAFVGFERASEGLSDQMDDVPGDQLLQPASAYALQPESRPDAR